MKLTEQSKKQKIDTNSTYFIVLLFITGYLLIDFLPSFKTIDSGSTHYLYLALLNIITGIYCYYNSQMLHQDLIWIYKKSSILKVYAFFLFFCAVSIITAGNVSLALVSFSKLLIVFCLFVNLTMLLYNRLNLLFSIVLIVGISVLIQSIVILVDFYKTLDLFAIKGNTGNINILAASLNIKVPFLIIGIIHFTRWKRILLVLALLLSTTIILLTSSRATFLGLVLIVFIFLFFYARVYSFKKTDYIKISFVLLPLLISGIVTNLIFAKLGDSERFKSIGNRISQIDPEDGSAKLRLQFWDNALKMIAEKPVSGIGVGNWKIGSLPYEKAFIDDSNISSNAHNDFMEVTAETGILNGLIYIALFVLLFFSNIKKILKSGKKGTQLVALLNLMLLVSYGFDALLNFPLYIPVMQLGFSFLLALTVINGSIPDTIKGTFFNSKAILCTTIGIGVVCFCFAFFQFRASQFEYKFKIYRALYSVDNVLPETGSLLESKDIINNSPKFPSVSYYSEPFIEYAGVSLFYEKKYDEALLYFKKANKINPHLGNSDWYIHKIELSKGNIDRAYEHAKIAFYKRPRNSDFYLAALFMANEKKDTLEMLKIHNQFSEYRKMPSNWINTSDALRLSGYSTKNLISFIDQGLATFPKDSLLLKRKDFFTNTVRDSYLLQAQQYGAEQKFEKALEYYKKALNEDPNNSIILQNIGICYFKQNQYKNAIYYLLKIENDDLVDGKTEYILGASYLGINNRKKGCWYLNLSKNKNFELADELVQKLCK